MTKPNLRILVITGTIRHGRISRKLADWYILNASNYRSDIEFELLDIADLNLPLFNEPLSPQLHQYSPMQKELAAKVDTADGFIFVTAEYNHAPPGSLKNFLDYLYTEWNYKAAAFLGYGVNGGVRSIEHLVQILTELRTASIRDHILVTDINSAIDTVSGKVKPEHIRGHITKQLDELAHWSYALRALRQQLHTRRSI